jgi:hypothetical protein
MDTNTLRSIAIAVLYLGLMVVLIDMYIFMRRRWFRVERPESSSAPFSPPVPGIHLTGELTTSAKYAIWSYMFSIFGIGGAVIGIVAGIAGYMINDLAKEKAIQVALNKMQEPLATRLAEFENAKAALNLAAQRITTDEFNAVLATKLSNDASFRTKIEEQLVTKHTEALRGKPGKDGMSPTVGAVAVELATKHVDELRGVAGKDGRDGKEGPSAAEVAELLVRKYVDQIRGPAGIPGKDGKNGTSPGIDVISAFLVSNYGNRLRGEKGAPGKDGKDGVSPSVQDIAAILVSKHGDQIRKILTPDVRKEQ